MRMVGDYNSIFLENEIYLKINIQKTSYKRVRSTRVCISISYVENQHKLHLQRCFFDICPILAKTNTSEPRIGKRKFVLVFFRYTCYSMLYVVRD